MTLPSQAFTLPSLSRERPSENETTAFVPVVIDWEYWIARRPKVLAMAPDLPKYLVLPEVHQVLHLALDQELHFLINLLWQSGARISEALNVRPEDLELDTPRNSSVLLTTSKRKPGRPSKKDQAKPMRSVPLVDEALIHEARRYLVSTKVKAGKPIFTLDRQQVDYRLKKIQKQLALPIESLSAHTFRHSYAVNCLFQNRDIRTIQGWLGHADLESTTVYLKVFSGETHHLALGMQF